MKVLRSWRKVLCVGDAEEAPSKVSGDGGVIAPAATIVEMASSVVAEGIYGAIVSKIKVSFMNPVYLGTELSVFCFLSKRKRQLAVVEVTFVDQEMRTLAKGSCHVLPQ